MKKFLVFFTCVDFCLGFDLLIKSYELVSEYSPAERLQLCSYHFQIVELKIILF